MESIEVAENILREIEEREEKAKKEWELEKSKTFRQRLEENTELKESMKIHQKELFKSRKIPEYFEEYWELLLNENVKNIKDFAKLKGIEI
jgi:hypothetical protein